MQNVKKWRGLLFVLPSLAGVSMFKLIPYADVLHRSFAEAVSGRFVGLKNYTALFQNEAFMLASANTVRFLFVCIPLLLTLSLAAAVCLARLKRIGSLLKSAFLAPMAVPAASVVLLWRILFHENGWINALLKCFGVTGVDWMNTDGAFFVLVISYIWKNLGYHIVLWLAGLAMIPPERYEAARVDGAGEWKCFTKITLPGLRSSIFMITVLSFLNAMKVFREAYLVAGEYPHDSIYLLQHLYNNWFTQLSLDKMAAGSVVTSLVMIIGIAVLKRLSYVQ